MSELVDEADSKSAAGDCVWVRVPLPAGMKNRRGHKCLLLFLCACRHYPEPKVSYLVALGSAPRSALALVHRTSSAPLQAPGL